MKRNLIIVLLGMLTFMCVHAEVVNESIRYITLSGNEVYAIPEKHILSEQQSGDMMTLSLAGGEEWSYSISNVVSVGSKYEGTMAELTSFVFTHEDNDQVYADVAASITEEDGIILVKADVPVIGKRLRPSFVTSEGSALYLDGKRIESGKDYFRFTSPVVFTLAKDNHYIYEVDDAQNGAFIPFGQPCEVDVKYLTDHATGAYKIPTVYITFGEDTTRWDDSQWIGMQLPDGTNTKEEWIEGCTFQLDGAGVWPDIDKVEDCEIRGRGNSSWAWSYTSKNPFRIKFPKKAKQSPFNLTEDRQWVFISNKQDGSMTTNSIAQKVAAMIDAEALCHMIPVDVYINGHYRGSYCFSEKIGIADNSVAIDETTGCLLELDDYYDETFKFRDAAFDLPVNIKDPDFSEEDDERVVTYDNIVASVNEMTSTLKQGGDISELVDMESWAKFWLVNDLVRNVETHHPKSCYLFNENPAEGEKWKFGPVWDFDWAFGYEDSKTYFINGADEDLFSGVIENNKAGYQFYNTLRKSNAGREAYLREWNKFMEEDRLGELLEYIDDYTEFVQLSIQHNNDADISEKNYTDYQSLAQQSKYWLTTRANYIYNSMQSADTPDSDEITTNAFIRNGICYRILSESEVEVTGLAYNYSSDAIVIPESVTFSNNTFYVVAIGNAAFVMYPLSSITLPNGLTRIGDKAFHGCSSISSITFPATMSSIGSRAFENCNMLSEVTSLSVKIEIGSECFANILEDAHLYVPKGTMSRYKNYGWFSYFSYLEEKGIPNDIINDKYIRIGTAQSSMTPNTWYFVHNSRMPNQTAVDFSEPGDEIKVVGGFVEDNGPGNYVLMSATYVISNSRNALAENKSKSCLVRFVPVDGKDDAYKVQFATGNWMKHRSTTSTHFTTTEIEEEATEFNFYLIDGNQRGRFGWNIYDMQGIVDNNGTGNTVALWDSGEITGRIEGNNVWQIYDMKEIMEVTIVDGSVDTYVNNNEQVYDLLRYYRTLPNLMWNALYVPFDIPVSELEEYYDLAYINDVHSFDYDDDGVIDDMKMEVIKFTSGTLKANTPYLIRAKNEAAKDISLFVPDAILRKTEKRTFTCTSMYMQFDVTGSYNSMSQADYSDILAISTDGSWKKLAVGTTLKPFRPYLTLTVIENSPLNISEDALTRMSIMVRGEEGNETGIDQVTTNHDKQTTTYYDLSGRRVKTPVKGGLYIVNGKKVVY